MEKAVAWRGPFRHVYEIGRLAGQAGRSISSCPYEDKKTVRGHVTFARGFLRAWKDGWLAGRDEVTKS